MKRYNVWRGDSPSSGNATLSSTCQITATNLSFGTYNPTMGDFFATGSLNILCTKGTTATYGINVGNGGRYTGKYAVSYYGNLSSRFMTNNGNNLFYNIFQDSSYSTVFGGFDWFAGLSKPSFVSTGITQTIPVYGAMGGAQYVVPGSYSDSVTAEVDF